MKIENIFTSFIATENLTGINNSELKKYANDLRMHETGVIKSNFLGWQSNILTVPNCQINMLVDEILKRIDSAKQGLGFREDTEAYLTNLWININPTCSFNRPHVHPDCVFSGVYYVECTADSGKLVCKHPAIAQQYSLKEETLSTFTEYNTSIWSITPEAGKLLIFPAWLEHYVEPNTSTEERISIAFNINIRKVSG